MINASLDPEAQQYSHTGIPCVKSHPHPNSHTCTHAPKEWVSAIAHVWCTASSPQRGQPLAFVCSTHPPTHAYVHCTPPWAPVELAYAVPSSGPKRERFFRRTSCCTYRENRRSIHQIILLHRDTWCVLLQRQGKQAIVVFIDVLPVLLLSAPAPAPSLVLCVGGGVGGGGDSLAPVSAPAPVCGFHRSGLNTVPFLYTASSVLTSGMTTNNT